MLFTAGHIFDAKWFEQTPLKRFRNRDSLIKKVMKPSLHKMIKHMVKIFHSLKDFRRLFDHFVETMSYRLYVQNGQQAKYFALRRHLFSTYAKFSEKLTFLTT